MTTIWKILGFIELHQVKYIVIYTNEHFSVPKLPFLLFTLIAASILTLKRHTNLNICRT